MEIVEMPMEQVPVLEIDGVKYHQHIGICRYIARKFGLDASDAEEAAQIDALIYDIEDMRLCKIYYDVYTHITFYYCTHDFLKAIKTL